MQAMVIASWSAASETADHQPITYGWPGTGGRWRLPDDAGHPWAAGGEARACEGGDDAGGVSRGPGEVGIGGDEGGAPRRGDRAEGRPARPAELEETSGARERSRPWTSQDREGAVGGERGRGPEEVQRVPSIGTTRLPRAIPLGLAVWTHRASVGGDAESPRIHIETTAMLPSASVAAAPTRWSCCSVHRSLAAEPAGPSQAIVGTIQTRAPGGGRWPAGEEGHIVRATTTPPSGPSPSAV